MNYTYYFLFTLTIFTFSYIIRKYIINWGTNDDDLFQAFPGDNLIESVITVSTRKIQIKASPVDIWPWLAQMGQGRGGFYSYTWLENLFGLNIQNHDTIDPGLQKIQIGDLIPFWEGTGVRVIELNDPTTLVLGGSLYNQMGKNSSQFVKPTKSAGGTWTFHMKEVSSNHTFLYIRTRIEVFKPYWICWIMARLIIEPVHYIMERKMMFGIKKRSEAKSCS